MAVSTSETQVTWSASNSVSVTSGSNQTSDAMTVPSGAVAGSVQLKADNAGTPASGDTIDFYVLYTYGDPDGASTDEYTTTQSARQIWQADTNAVDPDLSGAIPLDATAKAFKIYAVSNAASNSITVSATTRFTTVT